MSSSINTARLTEVTAIDSLSEVQLAAVRKLRRLAALEKVHPYTVAALASRSPNWERISDAKRYASLTPATREAKIHDIRDFLFPMEPAVVAVWSAWCEQNDVDPFAPIARAVAKSVETLTTDPNASVPSPALVAATSDEENGRNRNRPQRRGEKPAQELVEPIIRRLLAGDPVEAGVIYAATAGIASKFTVNAVADRIGVLREVTYGGGHGKRSIWQLPVPSEVPVRGVLMLEPEPAPDYEPNGNGITTQDSRFGYEPGDFADIKLKNPRLYLHTNPGLAEKAQRRHDQLRRIAKRHGMAMVTLARWAENYKTRWGHVYGSKSLLPERESEAGVELADEILRLALPYSPLGLVSLGQRQGWPER